MKTSKTYKTKNFTYELIFEEREKYLYAFVGKGKDSLDVSKHFWSRVLSECQKRGYNKLLVEEDLDGKISIPESYELAIWLTNLDFEQIMVCFVDQQLEHQELNRFAELIATNRGFRVIVFDRKEDAEKWLLSR